MLPNCAGICRYAMILLLLFVITVLAVASVGIEGILITIVFWLIIELAIYYTNNKNQLGYRLESSVHFNLPLGRRHFGFTKDHPHREYKPD